MTMDVGDQLPWLQNVIDDSGRPLNWRDTRRNRVVFFTHPGECAACTSYACDLMELRARLATWDGDVWLVGRAADTSSPAAEDVVRITGQADHRLRTRCDLSSTDAWVAVADRWGQIWQTAMADEHHTLVDPADVIETTRFIAIQCPECETLDQPAADWSAVR
ncbi:MAG TPA: hypothetical protein VK923_03925 [Euzebyales bacterium]|nr:hypothetical protein [Euzebyales bacterium]